jgi:predicted Fe-Mo cluster-binding NifX family protein
MKIAAITEDGKWISKHFGRAPYYLVLTIDNGEIIASEMREKLGHVHFSEQQHESDTPGEPHGMDANSHDKHLMMSDAIADCEALLCGGMGRGAYQSILARGIKPVVTDIDNIHEAVTAYVQGKIVDRVDLLH